MKQLTTHYTDNGFSIVHQTSERVRLRATNQIQAEQLDKLVKTLRQQNGVCEVRSNSTTKTLTITVDRQQLSVSEVLETLPQQHNTSIQPLQTPSSEPSLNWDELLQNSPKLARAILPLLVGMFITSSLGLQGLMAFPVFLITDKITDGLLQQLETQFSPVALVPENSSPLAYTQSQLLTPSKTVPSEIVHTIPGRMRFKIPRLGTDEEYAQRLLTLAEADPKIIEVRLKPEAASVAFHYQLNAHSFEQIKAHFEDLIQVAADPTIPIKLALPPENSEEEESPWANLTLPAITAGLALLGGPFGVPIPPAIIGGTIALTALPVAKRALESIINEQKLNIDFLDFAAITITTLQGQFLNPAIMLVLIELGEAIREQTARSSKKQTLDLLDSLKQFVWVERNGEKQEISIHEVKKGDIVIVYPGDQIPVDGRILRGKALIDEQKLTGESMPVMRTTGQHVYTSTLIREGQLYIEAEYVGSETRAGKIIQVMQEAPVHDTRIENYAAKVADQAVVPTLLMSGAMFGFTNNLGRAASILTIDFATGIRVSVPTTVLAALTYAARRGILIRSGRALEKLASIDAVVFDKTGTLTKGEPTVVGVESVNSATTPLKVLELAAAAEQRLTHPVANAIIRHAEAQGATIPERGEWHYEIGLGVRAEIEGKETIVGSDRFMEKEGINLDLIHQQYPQFRTGSCSIIYVATNGELQGLIAYRDPVRAESRDVIKALRTSTDMEIHLLTGDNKRTAAAVAEELGIPKAYTHAEAFPETKVAVVKALHDSGKTVAFVGDGINDSPALAYADVSISFGDGSDVARETADVVLMENNLQGLPEGIAIARQALQVIHQNTALVAVPNLAALIAAVVVGIDPLVATLVNNGSAILAGLNGLRPLLTSNEELNRLAANLKPEEPPILEVISSKAQELFDLNSQAQESTVSTLEETVTLVAEPVVDLPTLSQPVQVEAVVVHAVAKKPELLTAKALANRLKVSPSTISKRKSKSDFVEWTRQKDRDSIAWIYSPESERFMAV